MGKTSDEWEEHFKDISAGKRTKLIQAIKLLESEPMIKQEYEWTGLFSLARILRR